eukprot:gene23518-28474_t
MSFEMNPKALARICRENHMYSHCPHLNEILHLQCRGICRIQSLEEYTGLTAIYFNSNAIAQIEGLETVTNLRCLYIEQNLLEDFIGLENQTEMQVIDAKNNQISKIDGLSHMTKLSSLNLQQNRIETVDDIRQLLELPELRSLDISKNRIDDEEAIAVIQQLPLTFLKLDGNPVVRKVSHYRKTFIAKMPSLNYMDDMPVFPKERRLAEAFLRGGLEEEKLERVRIKEDEAAAKVENARAWEELVARGREAAKNKPPQKGMDLTYKGPEAIKEMEEVYGYERVHGEPPPPAPSTPEPAEPRVATGSPKGSDKGSDSSYVMVEGETGETEPAVVSMPCAESASMS